MRPQAGGRAIRNAADYSMPSSLGSWTRPRRFRHGSLAFKQCHDRATAETTPNQSRIAQGANFGQNLAKRRAIQRVHQGFSSLSTLLRVHVIPLTTDRPCGREIGRMRSDPPPTGPFPPAASASPPPPPHLLPRAAIERGGRRGGGREIRPRTIGLQILVLVYFLEGRQAGRREAHEEGD